MRIADRLEHVTAHAENLAFLDVAGRVAAVLLALAPRYGVEHGSLEIDLRLPQAELASWVCASREMVNKMLVAYREQELITMEGHTIAITGSGRSQALVRVLKPTVWHCASHGLLCAPSKAREQIEFSKSVKQFIAADSNLRDHQYRLQDLRRRKASHRLVAEGLAALGGSQRS